MGTMASQKILVQALDGHAAICGKRHIGYQDCCANITVCGGWVVSYFRLVYVCLLNLKHPTVPT